MPQSLSSILIHLVFSTKNREPFITPATFSIGQSNVTTLKRYIRNQKQHHQRVTFEDEYRKFLNAYGIVYDERYVWD